MRRLLSRLLGASSSAELARGAAGAFAVNVIGVAILYLTHVFLARVMGVEHYGVFTYVATCTGVLLLFGRIGLDTSILRYLAAYRSKGEWSSMRGILRRSDQLAVLASTAVGTIAAAVTWAARVTLGPELTRTFLTAFAILPLISLSTLRQAALRALGHPVLASLINSILRPFLLAILVGLLHFWHAGPIDGAVATTINGLAVAACFIAGMGLVRRFLPRPVMECQPVFRDRQWLTLALPAFLSLGLFVVLHSTDKIMIGAIVGMRDAGIYVAVSKSAGLTAFGLNAVSVVLAPMISRLHALGKRAELQRVLTLAAWGLLAFTVPTGLLLLVLGRHILGFFGHDFVKGYVALAILAAAQIVNALSGSVGTLLMMTGHQVRASVILAFAVLVNVALNAIMIPYFGLVGAAIATGVAMVLWNVLMLAHVLRRLGINPTVFAFGRRGEHVTGR